MDTLLRPARPVLWCLTLLSLATLVAQTAPPSSPPPAPTAAQPPQSIDFEALLASPDVIPSSITDPVWDVTPSPGRKLIQLPVKVEPGDQDLVLGAPGIEMRARFIAWRIVPDDKTNATAPGTPGYDPNNPTVGSSRNIGSLLLLDGNNFDLAGQRVPPHDPTRQAINTAAAVLDGELPDGAPALTTKLTVKANGGIVWKLERSVPGGKVKEGQAEGYTLKLRPDLLAARQPKRAQATDAAQRRAQEYEFQAAMGQFRELQKLVRALPEEFEIDLPSRLWAIYEIPTTAQQLTFGGEAPWSIRMDQLEALRAAAAQPVSQLDANSFARIGVMLAMARDNHPLSHRVIALALARGGLVGLSTLNDTLYQLLQTLIQGPDDEARRLVVERLALTIPPTSATTTLLRDAARYMTPDMQLVALKGLLAGGATDPNQLRDMLENANRALADLKGPDAGVVLEAVASGVTDLSGPTASTFISGIRFETLPPQRLDPAIAYAIRNAGVHPLASAWLNLRLLGSSDPRLSRRTYELLSRTSGGSGVLEPIGKGLLSVVFGSNSTGASTPDSTASLDLTLAQPIPLDSINHSLFRGINSGDSSLRDLAWAALPNFGTGSPADPQAPQPMPAQPIDPQAAEQAVDQLVSAGLSRKPTPPQLAMFLAQQKASPRATLGLIQLVLAADTAAAKQASRGLLGSGREITEPLRSLPSDQRAEFAGQLYQNLKSRSPLVVGLLSDPQSESTLLDWFADAIAAGTLPEPAAWAEQYGNEQALIAAASSSEPRIAGGGAAGLVASAGGDLNDADELAARFRSANDRSPTGLAAAWATAKKDIYARKLEQAKGSYRVVVRLYETGANGAPAMYGPPPGAFGPMGPYGDEEQGQPAFTTPPTRTINVGVVDLNVEGQAVFLGNKTVNFTLPEDRLALQLTASDIKNFQNDELKDVTLEHVSDPVRLLPRDDGGWRGHGAMLEGTGVEILLDPVGR